MKWALEQSWKIHENQSIYFVSCTHGILRGFTGIRWILWIPLSSMEFHTIPRNSIESIVCHGNPKNSTDFHGIQEISWIRWILWNSMVPMGSTESHGFHGIPLVPWNSTDLEPHGFHGVSWPPRIPPTDATVSTESDESLEFHALFGIPWNSANFTEFHGSH